MPAITITLSDEAMATLQNLANQAGCSPEEHLARTFEQFLNQSDDELLQVSRYVLAKNAVLYRGLA
jgi:hypothetical protein